MKDGFGRTIDYIRISVTDRCNLRCVYCMPEDGVTPLAHGDILSYEEILRVCGALAKLGVTKVKLTGGEPLIRKDLNSLVSGLKSIAGIQKVTLTTNGVLLADQLPGLMAAGLDAVNISMDTLDQAQYRQVTRCGTLDDVLQGLTAALSYETLPVKINCVPIFSDHKNLLEMTGLAKDRPVHVRFIEMMPIGLGRNFDFLSEDAIKAVLEPVYGTLTPCEEILGNGPCHYYTAEGFLGKIGFISAISHKFCHQCNRVRLTAEGFLKTCLQYETGSDLKVLMRSGGNDQALMAHIQKTIFEKPACHHFNEGAGSNAGAEGADEDRRMYQIGG